MRKGPPRRTRRFRLRLPIRSRSCRGRRSPCGPRHSRSASRINSATVAAWPSPTSSATKPPVRASQVHPAPERGGSQAHPPRRPAPHAARSRAPRPAVPPCPRVGMYGGFDTSAVTPPARPCHAAAVSISPSRKVTLSATPAVSAFRAATSSAAADTSVAMTRGLGHLLRQRTRDDARARPDVGDDGSAAPAQAVQQPQHDLGQRLRLRPRYQHRRSDLELAQHERGRARDVLHGLAGKPPLESPLERGQLSRVQLTLELDVQFDARQVKGVRQQQLDLEAGVVEALLRKMALAPVDEFENGPGAGLRHGSQS